MLQSGAFEDMSLRYHADNISKARKKIVLMENGIYYVGDGCSSDIGRACGDNYRVLTIHKFGKHGFVMGVSVVIYAIKGTVGQKT